VEVAQSLDLMRAQAKPRFGPHCGFGEIALRDKRARGRAIAAASCAQPPGPDAVN